MAYKENFENSVRRVEHPRPETLQKYYQFADEYLCNGFVAYKAWQKVYPNQSKSTAMKAASLVMCHNQEIKDYVARRKKEIFEAEHMDLDTINYKLMQITDDQDTAARDRISALKAIQSSLLKLKELDAKEKADDKDAKIEVKLVD